MNDVVEASDVSEDVGFAALARLAHREAGLVLSPSKSAMIKSRLRHRLRSLGITDLLDYCDYVEKRDKGQEKVQMINALTTNVTSFFREPHHFEHFKEQLSSKLKEKILRGEKFRIWSAGCSNGQEPYSIAIMLKEMDISGIDDGCRILATDIDANVLRTARLGVYTKQQVEGVKDEHLTKFFASSEANNGETLYKVTSELRDLVTFNYLNLMDEWPMKEKIDVVFCRNVVIYFDGDTQDRLWSKFFKALQPGGTIFVGHSERLESSQFESIGSTTYIRKNEHSSRLVMDGEKYGTS